MTSEQQAAHLRMLTYLPRRTHLKMMDEQKQEELKETEARHNLKLRKPILANGKVYPSVTEAMHGERIAACTLYERLRKGLYRYMDGQLSDGMPTFNASTSRKGLRARIRRREREAAK